MFSEITENKKHLAVLVLSVIGLLISMFIALFIEKGVQAPACNINGTPFSCESVINSSYGNVFGIPVSDIGAFYFLILIALFLVGIKDDLILAIVTLVGLVSIAYFIFVELFILQEICLYCTSVHIVVIIIFLLIGPESIKNSYKMYQKKKELN